tara:strand:+ start:684 stop:1832 length:1149 start_codon:yes stop_codon:yes gene_type:complete
MSNRYQKDVTFVFGSGRKIKIESSESHGKEFFYGYLHLRDKGYSVDIIETNKINTSKLIRYALKFTERLFSKFTKLTFYFTALISTENLSKLYKSRNIITSNHGIGMTLFIFIGIFKIFKKINFIVILSGLFAMKDTLFIIKVFRKVFLTIFLKVVNKLIFTSRSEYHFAVNKYPKYKEKFECIPFCLDTDFWKPQNNNIDINKKKGVLFIGNNGHRDFNLVIKIAEELNEIPFTFITNQISDSEIKSDNITNILGDWNAAHLSDVEIKQYYESSKLVILPINNTLVSSGQSAGLQAAAVGTAVVTTKTIGFWDYESYKDGENILFVENNELKNWTSIVKEAYENDSLLLNIGKNSKKLVNNTYHLDIFNTKLESFLAFENV